MRRAIAIAVLLGAADARAAQCDELVRQAAAREAAGDDAVAARRYTEALALDATCGPAYLGLAALRLRQRDGREAERVALSALEHLPGLRGALAVLARARWLEGRRDEAERDLARFAATSPPDDARAALRQLAEWYGVDGNPAAQLAAWRRLSALAEDAGDAPALREARTTVRALLILVGPADPVSAPPADTPARRAAAAAARRP